MAKLNVKPTRGELTKLRERLALASRGHKLLKDKQDELMRQFITLIRENNELRKKVESQLIDGMQEFVLAKSLESNQVVEEMLAIPMKSIDLSMSTDTIMSVRVPKLFTSVYEENTSTEVEYSFVASNSGMDDAILAITESVDDLMKLAEIEKTCQLMADEIEKTRRRVNGLEYRIIPQLEETIYYIEMKLEENERASVTRMMKVKDMK